MKIGNLNTSHVKVNLCYYTLVFPYNLDLNTSHVKVNPISDQAFLKASEAFKYISC